MNEPRDDFKYTWKESNRFKIKNKLMGQLHGGEDSLIEDGPVDTAVLHDPFFASRLEKMNVNSLKYKDMMMTNESLKKQKRMEALYDY